MQNSGSSRKTKYDAAMRIFVDGNTARQLEEVPYYQDFEEREKRRRKVNKARALAQKKKAESQKKAMIGALTAIGTVLGVGILVLMLSCVVESNALSNEIASLESELQDLTEQNDSKEFDIESSMDLNTVIDRATNELGMVRATAAQIVYYSTTDDEYVQQVAEIPGN